MMPPLVLPGDLTIYAVGELKPQWSAWLQAAREAAAGDDACHVHASAVDEVDAAGVQLLLALSHGLAKSGLRLHLAEPSGPLARACEALGVGHLLDAARADEVHS